MLAERIVIPPNPLQGVPVVRTLALVGGVNGPSLYRHFQPVAELNRNGYKWATWDFMGDNPNAERALLGLPPVKESSYQKALAFAANGRLDAIILARTGWAARDTRKARQFVRNLKDAGNCLIYEADDDLFSPWITPQQHQGILAHQSPKQLEEERLTRIQVLQMCDGATVSTKRLATVVRQYVPDDFPVEVVPNLIDWDWWTRIKQVAKRWIPPITIGWAGGGRPQDDLALIADAWGEIARAYPDVRFVLQGMRPGDDGQPSLDATPWAQPIAQAVPHDRLELLPFFGIKEYPLGMLNIDILCCPLVDRPFNRCKSNVKVLEGAAAGSAVVASPTVYKDVIDPWVDGYLATTTREWVDAIRAYLNSDLLRTEMAGKLALKVWQRYNLQTRCMEWPLSWWKIIQQAKKRKQRLVV